MAKVQGKKMLNWVFGIVILGLAAVIIGGALVLNQLNQRKNELAEIIRANPNTTTLVTYTVDEQGQPVEDGSQVFYHADTPLVLAPR
jgi:hypothetical protein